MRQAVAEANANVALAKYWGKRDDDLNLPYTGSLSVTLAGLSSRADVVFDASLAADEIHFGEISAPPAEAAKMSRFLDLVRAQAGFADRARVTIRANFPVASGLASSASTFAALALAASTAAGLSLDQRALSILARRGSGSASRSIHGGWVEWVAGEASDGSDSFGVQVVPADHWPLAILVAVTDEGPKKIGSREGMSSAVKTSALFPAWLETHEADQEEIRAGVLARDLVRVGTAAERNCLKMHAVAMTAQPPLLYWKPATVGVMHRVAELREEGIPAYFTIDAGPQVKVLCAKSNGAAVAAALTAVTGVQRVLFSEPGGPARLIGSEG